MHYQTFKIKMPDLRGGFVAFTSKPTAPKIVDGVCYIYSRNEINAGDSILRPLLGSDITVLSRESHKEVTEADLKDVAEKYKKQLEKNGIVSSCMPNFSAHIKPFGD
jgi:hypothetical protein